MIPGKFAAWVDSVAWKCGHTWKGGRTECDSKEGFWSMGQNKTKEESGQALAVQHDQQRGAASSASGCQSHGWGYHVHSHAANEVRTSLASVKLGCVAGGCLWGRTLLLTDDTDTSEPWREFENAFPKKSTRMVVTGLKVIQWTNCVSWGLGSVV